MFIVRHLSFFSFFFFFLMIRRPPRSTLFPTRRSSDLHADEPPPPPRDGICRVPRPLRDGPAADAREAALARDRKSTRLNSSHGYISYAVFCLKKKKKKTNEN